MNARKIAVSAAVLLAASPWAARAGQPQVKCTMTFTLSGWSIFYSTADGEGEVHCSNGQSAHVKLHARGGGLTAGKSREEGRGEFSDVYRLEDVLGSYAAAEAHAGAVNSAQAQVMTKGEVSLALSGKGQGWSLGINFGRLVIER
ncbi:MAG TPA: hypothetical protein VMB48_13325 [Steroidobacteraceae bacterium]|nr:hypothetical protein [Steroidobacteraceae bacterium]